MEFSRMFFERRINDIFYFYRDFIKFQLIELCDGNQKYWKLKLKEFTETKFDSSRNRFFFAWKQMKIEPLYCYVCDMLIIVTYLCDNLDFLGKIN